MSAIYFLIDQLFNLYLMAVILRLWLQLARADFYNPVSQFVVKATQPAVGPLRRLIPSIGALDTATLVFAFAVASLKVITISLIFGGGFPPALPLLITALALLISQILTIIFVVLLIRVILSWVSQGNNPMELVMMQLTEPFLAPIRRVIPPIGGLDLSVLIAILAIQAIKMLFGDILGPGI
ncbi:YggT family protein [Glaciecola sp. SC05]|uniref:YggT family protein n=1 Tax=Glaciecola sp. SC05 TaxID=1987355 RepID=UPI003529A651